MLKSKPDHFTSRCPRNREEIETCIAMLEDSPFYDPRHCKLTRSDQVDVWEELLTTGQGHIDIVENESYDDVLQRYSKSRRNPQYRHKFFLVFFIQYFTRDFLRDIIAREDLHDMGLHFVEQYLAHKRRPDRKASPTPTVEEMLQDHNSRDPLRGLYGSSFLVLHPEVNLRSERVFADINRCADRVRRSTKYFHGGLKHHAWINSVYDEIIVAAYQSSGHRVLRPYPGNEVKSASERKHILCLTKDQCVSAFLGIDDEKEADLASDPGNFYRFLFDQRTPKADLTKLQQQTCYYIALGYTNEQIARFLFPNEDLKQAVLKVNSYQSKACARLEIAGYNVVVRSALEVGGSEDEPETRSHGLRSPAPLQPASASSAKVGRGLRYSREKLANVIRENYYEVRSLVIAPLYPAPKDHVMPE